MYSLSQNVAFKKNQTFLPSSSVVSGQADENFLNRNYQENRFFQVSTSTFCTAFLS